MAAQQRGTVPRVRLGVGPISATVSALWALVGLEVAAIVGLRHYFRKHHGG